MSAVTVSQALSRGHRMVTWPSILIFIPFNVASVFLGIEWKWEWFEFLIGIVVSIIVVLLFWRHQITKWRLWAFEEVNQPNRLMVQAIQENLIYSEGHWVTRLESRSEEQKQQWEMILLRMEQPDSFEDDVLVPETTIIGYSGWKNWLQFAMYIAMFFAGLFMMLKTEAAIFGLIASLFGLVLSVIEFKQATNKKPQIIISNKGIETANTPFYSWEDVNGEWATQEGSGKHIRYFLEYNHPAGAEKFSIDDMATDIRSLNELLALYRGRFEQKTNSHKP